MTERGARSVTQSQQNRREFFASAAQAEAVRTEAQYVPLRDYGLTRPVVAVCCRPPVVQHRRSWRPAPGGVAPLVGAVVDHTGGTYVSWDGGAAPPPASPSLHTFSLPDAVASAFYDSHANRVLWPRLHGIEPPVDDADRWPACATSWTVRSWQRTTWQQTPHSSRRSPMG